MLTDPDTGTNVDGVYWKYETFLKQCESRLGALLGSNGAIYAIRRELFEGIPPDTVLDDFVIPLLARMRTGKRIIYDPEARADEETPKGIGQEFKRRARIGAGGFQCIGMLRGLLHPRHGWTAFTFWSHKVLRWACPFLLVAALATNLVLAAVGGPLYQRLLAGQVLFYALAVLGTRLPAGRRCARWSALTTMFMSMNAALLVGFVRWARGSQRAAWDRTARAAGGRPADGPRGRRALVDTMTPRRCWRWTTPRRSPPSPTPLSTGRQASEPSGVRMSVWPFTIAARRGFGGWLPTYLATAGRRRLPEAGAAGPPVAVRRRPLRAEARQRPPAPPAGASAAVGGELPAAVRTVQG